MASAIIQKRSYRYVFPLKLNSHEISQNLVQSERINYESKIILGIRCFRLKRAQIKRANNDELGFSPRSVNCPITQITWRTNRFHCFAFFFKEEETREFRRCSPSAWEARTQDKIHDDDELYIIYILQERVESRVFIKKQIGKMTLDQLHRLIVVVVSRRSRRAQGSRQSSRL